MSKYNSTDNMANDILSRLCGSQNTKQNSNCSQSSSSDSKNPLYSLSPSKALVIVALLSGVLDVYSILVDREQTVQILLEGSLKQKDSGDQELANMLDSIGGKSFDDVVRALINRLS